MLMLLLLGGGVVAAMLLPVQSFPDYDPRLIEVVVPFPGASPAEVEDGITRRVEERVRDVGGVSRVHSTASEGMGIVVAELETFANKDSVFDNIQIAVDSLQNFPPQLAEKPRVGMPSVFRLIATLVVSSSTATESDLRNAAELVRGRLLALPTVSRVDVFGAREPEISIEVSEAVLLRNDLTVEEVAAAVRQASVQQSSGELRTEAGGLVIRTNTKSQSVEEFKNIAVITRIDGSIVRLGDIAEINDGFVDMEVTSRVDNVNSLFLRVRESDEGDPQILPAAEDILAEADSIELPAGIKLSVWEDASETTRVRVEAMIGYALFGVALVFLLLVLVSDLRLAVWVTLGIPISFLGAMLFFEPLGLTLNSTTMFALVLVIGIVVDDAIVVGESIAAQQEAGNDGIEGARQGAREVAGPVVTGVVTTMIAFAPLIFVPGVIGQVLSAIPIVVIAVLVVSLVEAFFILPSHLAHGRKWSLPPLSDIQQRGHNWLANLRDNVIVRAISAALLRPWLTIGASLLFLVFAAGLVWTATVKFVLFEPPADVDRISVQLTFPIGVPFDVTQAAADRIVGAAYALEESLNEQPFNSIGVVVGGQLASAADSFDLGQNVGEYATHLATVVALLNDESRQSTRATELMHLWRNAAGEIEGAENIEWHASSVVVVPEVAYTLTHPDIDSLQVAVDELQARLDAEPGVFGSTNSLNLGKRQFDITINPVGLSLGMNAADVARQLRSRFYGAEVQRNQRGRDEMRVVVRYPDNERIRLADVMDERIAVRADPPFSGLGSSATSAAVPLAIIADVVERRGYAAIQRLDGVRSALLNARVDTAQRAPNEITSILADEWFPELQERYPGLEQVRAGQLSLQDRMFEILALLVPVAILAIYAIIAVQLRSYALPLIVMAAVPFASAGAIVGHFLLNYDIMAYSVFGMIAIGGVVVNDVLVLLDRYKRIKAESGISADIALIAAATRHRFRAILLTSVTTLMALLPTLYSTNPDTAPLIPLVVSLVFGLLFANAILLFFVPALLALVEGAQERMASRRRAVA